MKTLRLLEALLATSAERVVDSQEGVECPALDNAFGSSEKT